MAFNIVAGVNNAVYGSVSGSGSYEENAEVTLEVTANDGYRFVQWDDGNTDNPRVFNATADVTLVATLEAIPEYTVTLTENNSNLGSTSGSGNYLEGSTATISATPALHCRFVKWDDDNTDNPRTLTVNAAVTLEAIFETVNWYTITAVSSDDTMGSVTGSGDYDEGSTVTLTAVPETDHKFTEWSDGNTDNPRIFTASQSLNLSATFAAIIYSDVTIASNDNELGTVSGATSGNIETGSSITLTATPATDCIFDGWQVNGEMLEDTSTTITITVAENEMDVIAVFSAIVFYQVNLLSSDTDCGYINVVSQTAEPRGTNNNIWPEGTVLELAAVEASGGRFLNWGDGSLSLSKTITVYTNQTVRANFYPVSGLILVTKKIFQHAWNTIKSFFSAPTGASKIGAPANNALGATTLADVVNSVGQANGLAQLNEDGKINISDLGGSGAEGLDVDITGNAATATNAANADVATKLGTATVGASDTPIYLNAGTATACGGSLAVDITGNAATASKLGTTTVGSNSSPIYLDAGTPTSCAAKLWSLNNYGETKIENNSDFNSFTTPGVYYTEGGDGGSTTVNTSSNRPPLVKGLRMVVQTCGQNNQYINQIVFYKDGSLYMRHGSESSGSYTFGSWKQIAFTDSDITGNAATATTATNANNAKLTHTVGNTEYPLVFATSAATNDGNQALRIGCPTTTLANCALRCKAYCAAANTQGESTLIIGNNLATASANNSRGRLILYGTSTGYTILAPGYNSTSNITVTLPSSTGTLALTSSDITGNAATATTASACSGNAATATSATKATMTAATAATWYSLVATTYNATSGTAYGMVRLNNANSRPDAGLYYDANATSGKQRVILNLGNATANTTAAGKNGLIQLWGTGTTSTCIVAGNPSSGNTVTLPTGTGTLALTSSDITGNAATATTATSATTASACSGTSTYATNAKLTHTVGNAEYPLVFGSSFKIDDSQQGLKIGTPSTTSGECPLRIKAYCAAANTQGEAYIVLGNNLAKASANNARGGMYIFGTSTYRLRVLAEPAANKDITIATTGTTARTYTLPDAAGTIALTSSNITGSATKWGGYALKVDTVANYPASPDANTIYLLK